MVADAVFDDERSVWQRFVRNRDPGDRETLIACHADLARMHAAKLYADRQILEIEFDEFHQYALVGLVEAVDRFDPEREASFKTYAGHRIRGAILNGIEKYCEKQQQIAARTRLREERLQELLSGVTAEETDPFLRLVDLAIGTAIGFMLEDSRMYQAEERAYEHNIYRSRELKDLARTLETLVETLPNQEQAVIRDHYYLHVRFDQIAANMGVSKGRVSQIHHRALRRMREHYDQLQLLRTDY